MSWYLPHHLTSMHLPFMRLSAMHKGISVGLLCSVGTAVILPAAQAATMGKTVITSVQHQPLTASITVTSIRSADFSARLASPIIYQQLGLTPQPSMSVSFVPTSATTGTVVITSTQPITMPFTDVVLALSDQGQRKVIPKTLLMPLATSDSIKQSSSILATTRQSDPSTLIVNAHTANPLVVKRGAPPKLANVRSIQPVIQANKTVTLPVNDSDLLSDKNTDSPQILVASRKAPPPLFSSPKPAEPVYNAGLPIDLPVKKSPSLAESNTSSPQIMANSHQISPPAFATSKPALATSKIVKPISNTSKPIELSVKKRPSLAESNASSSQIIANIHQVSLPLLATPKPALAKSKAAMPDFNTSTPIELPVKKSPSLAESNTSSPQILVASRKAPPPLFSSPKSVEPVFNASQPIELPVLPIKKSPSLAESNTSSPQILVASRQAPPPLFASPKLASPKTQKTDILVQSRVPHNTISINERRINTISTIRSQVDIDQVVPLIAINNTFDTISSSDVSVDRIIELASVAKIDNEQRQPASRLASYPSLNTQISRKIMTVNLNFDKASSTKTISTKDHTQNRLSPLATQNLSTPSYIVQKNDNLWVISQQVAEQNNLDVLMVMNQIKSQNLDAFINKNSNHLKVDAKLDLSYYDTVPSQQGLQAAIADKRQQRLNSNKTA